MCCPGAVPLSAETYRELQATGEFDMLDADADEAEHSLELQMGFLTHMMRGHPFELVPIMVGALTPEGEARYGQMLAKYADDPKTLFIISSDFCHWGTRFNFTFTDKSKGPIYKAIEWLDHEGMDLIEQVEPKAFTEYLRRYGNTICGRHPIGVFLQIAKHAQTQFRIKFLHYDQSSRCYGMRDSSVSYAAAVVTADGEQ
ncbi:g10649 [Coccomyxa viridis]|uniref:G10649 protein n=1 Tax=Coccomyxa viridis TaxID=1274662 RepID=A0ABP1GAF5_9CHLO